MLPSDIEVLARPVAHLPFVRAVVDQLGILGAIDERCPKHPLNRVSDAQCVLALILNVLCGRPALYRMDQWLGRLDTEVLFGPETAAEAFNDTRLAEALDHLDEAGTDTLLADIVRAYLAEEGEPRSFSVHHDTTSVSLEGAYDTTAEPTPAYGYSKDKRPDLKQLIYGLTLHGAVGMPLVATVTAGNTSDPAMARDHLARLREVLPEEHEVTFVGDCKLVDARTLGRLLRAGMHFVSLLPDNYSLRQELIEEAWTTHPKLEDWPMLAEKPGRTRADPPLCYRGASVVRPAGGRRRHGRGVVRRTSVSRGPFGCTGGAVRPGLGGPAHARGGAAHGGDAKGLGEGLLLRGRRSRRSATGDRARRTAHRHDRSRE